MVVSQGPVIQRSPMSPSRSTSRRRTSKFPFVCASNATKILLSGGTEPSEPTPEEMDKHWTVNFLCRSWRLACVKERVREDPHRTQKDTKREEEEFLWISIDFTAARNETQGSNARKLLNPRQRRWTNIGQ